jgi:hypothetical protein
VRSGIDLMEMSGKGLFDVLNLFGGVGGEAREDIDSKMVCEGGGTELQIEVREGIESPTVGNDLCAMRTETFGDEAFVFLGWEQRGEIGRGKEGEGVREEGDSLPVKCLVFSEMTVAMSQRTAASIPGLT